MRMPLAAAIGPFMSLLLSPQPVLCMVSEAKQAVDHTTLETLVAVGFLQHCAKVMISNFPEIGEFREGISVKFRCIYCSIVGEISRNETNCREYSFRPDKNLAQNEGLVLFVHF